MLTWLADKVAPGLITSAVTGLWMWLSHRRLRQHISVTAGEHATRQEQAAQEQARTGTAALTEARGARTASEAVLAQIDAAHTIAGKNDDGKTK